MEGEREEQGESTQSVTTSTQADAPTQNGSEDSEGSQNLEEPEEDSRGDGGAGDGEVEASQIGVYLCLHVMKVGEYLCIGDEETPVKETLVATNAQDDADCLPLPPLTPQDELTPPSVSPHPSKAQSRLSGPCWYCLRSLDSEYRPETPEQEDSDPLSPLPSSGQRVKYQTDPRPHFGVAWSSHSTCRPLWGSEGPCWGQRNQEAPDQTHTCPHCNLGLPADTLRWHEAKCLLFEGLRSSKK
ncbi:uncharacterized protein LOC119030929 isoform X1 [Acanthopagrus latus]|uniref:uncharacterized protein LOC119030929 isoform X1 n=1 Tax=Acanthopagrus latus TaxID=8177 RepID=UPI00187C2C2C|nr:uncharacterized protein LOC119030929 isoform X1 [Acanthopagrus latus]